MKFNQFKITAKVWVYEGEAAWHFITIPQNTSDEIKLKFSEMKRGWGSLPVTVKTKSGVEWKTSIFPDKKLDTYLLPLKKEIRKKENIKIGDSITLLITISVDTAIL